VTRVNTQALKNNGNSGVTIEQTFLELCKKVTSSIQKA